MKSIQIKRYSGRDVMKVNNVASGPNPSSGKILVNAKASGVNPIDRKMREGNMQQMITLQFPSSFGMDFSGVIKQVGENVPSDFKQGDEVYGQASVLRVVQEHLLNWLWQTKIR
jgi:NADPH:quinone reductase-like Zn-dependent oxidoreductase